ncbi:DUF354 domain-containing protein [Algoriphagus namhaensis]
MNIFIDINHPAHVHYFKNFIFLMKDKGYRFVVSNRNSVIINKLLDEYNISHTTRGKRPLKNSFINSLWYLISMVRDVFKISSNENIDLFLGFASPACSIVGWLRRKPAVILDDTEHNGLNHSIYGKFCSVILTPFYFKKNLGPKQISFQAYVEQFYIHSKYFIPKKVLPEDEYALVRFISYDARHDSGVVGAISDKNRVSLVKSLASRVKVYITMETEEANHEFDEFALKIQPSDMHNVIANCSLFITEGATMGIEAGLMGVNYYYINPLEVGNVAFQSENYKNAHVYNGDSLASEVDNIEMVKRDVNLQRDIEKNTINPTDFLIWFVSNFPESVEIMRENPEYQNEIL